MSPRFPVAVTNCETIPGIRNRDRGWGISGSAVSKKEGNIKYLQKYGSWELDAYILLNLPCNTCCQSAVKCNTGLIYSLFELWLTCVLHKINLSKTLKTFYSELLQELPQCSQNRIFLIEIFTIHSECRNYMSQLWRLRHAHVNLLARITLNKMIGVKRLAKYW